MDLPRSAPIQEWLLRGTRVWGSVICDGSLEHCPVVEENWVCILIDDFLLLHESGKTR